VIRLRAAESWLASAAVVSIAAIVAFQALVAHPSTLWFDVDPASDPFPFAGLAPSVGLALDASALALAAVALFCARRGIDRTGRWITFLSAGGACVAAIHCAASADQCWRGMQWIAAVVGGAAIAVATRALPPDQGRTVRRAVLAVLIAAAVPIAWRGAMQVLVEHPATVAHFEASKSQFLAARGWAEGSPQALTYERRLLQPEATGWFGMSNVASSVLAAGSIAFAGAAIALMRVRPLGMALLGTASLACAALAVCNGSKGALAAMAVGGAFAAWCAWRAPATRARVHLALAVLALPIVAVGVRALVGTASGERSLLFRVHYAEGALRMVAESPVLGVGPSGFGPAYLRLRPWDSPEEVQSAHAAWADWIASLGLGGVAWCAVLGVLVACAARAAVREPAASGPRDVPTPEPSAAKRLVPFAIALTAALLAIIPELQVHDEASLAMRVLAALFSATCASLVVRAFDAPGGAFAAGVSGAAIALAVHAQVEMTLWWPGAIGWVACFVGAAAGGAGRPSHEPAPQPAGGDFPGSMRHALVQGAMRAMTTLLVAFAALVLALEVPGAASVERIQARAAEPLVPFGRARLGLGPAPQRTIADARFEAAGLLDRSVIDFSGGTPRTMRWLDRPAIQAASIAQYAQAVAQSDEAADRFSLSARLQEMLGMLSEPGAPDARSESVCSASALLAEAVLAQARAGVDTDEVLAASELRRWGLSQVELNPRSVRGWMRAAEGAAALGQREDAARFAGNAFGVDASYALDPLRRMPEADRVRMQAIIDAASVARP
jgi:hypothetical protein